MKALKLYVVNGSLHTPEEDVKPPRRELHWSRPGIATHGGSRGDGERSVNLTPRPLLESITTVRSAPCASLNVQSSLSPAATRAVTNGPL